MAWALIDLGRGYQVGGSAPRPDDRLVTAGPYRFVRHPMYAAALAISLGLSLLLQSAVFAAVFGIYLALILALIPAEEAGCDGPSATPTRSTGASVPGDSLRY